MPPWLEIVLWILAAGIILPLLSLQVVTVISAQQPAGKEFIEWNKAQFRKSYRRFQTTLLSRRKPLIIKLLTTGSLVGEFIIHIFALKRKSIPGWLDLMLSWTVVVAAAIPDKLQLLKWACEAIGYCERM